ncbi:spore coat protein [Gehongia tenuis]|jgi:spore coat protein F|nr:spore coat protein [Gehongia tenuis]
MNIPQQNPMNNGSTGAMSEKELLNDLLTSEKQIIGLYETGITETTYPELRNVMNDNLNQLFNDQYQIFDHMRQKGYYQVKAAPAQDIDQARQQFSQMQTQMGQ